MKKLLHCIVILSMLTGAIGYVIPRLEAAQDETVRSITLPEIHVELREGEGVRKVETFCTICHSPDYIVMQPRFSSDKWSSIVHKMIVVFGAPVSEEDSKEIINYLYRVYGTGK